MDIVTKKKLNILIQLAEADKHFAKVERDMILRIAQERSFSEEDVFTLIRNPEPIGSLGALSPDQKFEYLVECVDLIFADQRVFESELIFSRGIAIKLGFKKNVIDFLVENLKKKGAAEVKQTVFSEYV